MSKIEDEFHAFFSFLFCSFHP